MAAWGVVLDASFGAVAGFFFAGRLLDALIDASTVGGARQMLAVIGDSANAGSIGLHRARGFTELGRLPAVGWKFERWLDVVLMQRALGAGAENSPV